MRNDPGTLVLLGKGDGSFSAGTSFDFIANYAAAGDLNGDHRKDLVLAGLESTSILLGDGDGKFTLRANLDSSYGLNNNLVFSINIQPTGVYIGDLK